MTEYNDFHSEKYSCNRIRKGTVSIGNYLLSLTQL